MTTTKGTWQPIKLSAKVFGHISQGLYRTPAGAIKELISNAFDADATLVRVHTGFPRFDTFSCEDDGRGLSLEEFKRLMKMGIGTSMKRFEQSAATTLHGRQIIGRLGIGLLSIAQICSEFDLISHCDESKTAFQVSIRFPAYTKEDIDRIKPQNSDDVIESGEYKVSDIGFDPAKRGVRIFTHFLRQSFRKRLSDLTRYGNSIHHGSTEPYRSFHDFTEAIYEGKDSSKSLTLASDYDQLLFGLSLIPPLPYLDNLANIVLQLPPVAEYQKRLQQNKFRLVVDNLELRRPLKLPSDLSRRSAATCLVEGKSTKSFELVDGPLREKLEVRKHDISVKDSDERFSAYYLEYYNHKVSGRPLKFWGYLFQQTGRMYPRDIQGVIVRIKDVAIGAYDNSLMVYPYGEGPRYSMLSGELIVEEGFEDALNIDRDSFNMLHPHYLRMQAYLHGLCHDIVFPGAWGEEKARNKARRGVAKAEKQKEFLLYLRKQSKGKLISIEKVESDEPNSPTPIKCSFPKRAVVINVKHPLLKEALKRRKYEDVVIEIVVAYEKAQAEHTERKQREVFYGFLARIFAE
jgi:hypothetical protein